jgi:hypothetical protein
MKTNKTYPVIAIAAALLMALSSFPAKAGSTSSLEVLRTAEQAKALPEKANVMMACAGCQTIQPVEKKGLLSWFSTKQKHDCPACGGKVTFRTEKTGGGAKFTHTCSMCGDASAYVCANH